MRTTVERVTARQLLFGDGEADRDGRTAAEQLERAVADQRGVRSALNGVRRLSGGALSTVEAVVAQVGADVLDVDLGDALVEGWRRYSALTEAARRTLAEPGSEEVLDLVTHRFTTTYSPCVDVFVDGHLVHTVELSLGLVLDVSGLVAVVRGGALVALRGGGCTATATLLVDEVQVARRTATLDPSLVVSLQPAVALVDREVPAQVVRVDTLEAKERVAD